jgi:UDP-N-acetylmuramoyl-L-alanyl-D-glutamate--2,6-diaminopimelate ligase
MKLDQLLSDIVPTEGADERDICGIVSDSRQVRSGSLFVAVPGYWKDGADYIEDAVRRGASAIVSEKRTSSVFVDVPVFRMDDTRLILALLAAKFYGHPARQLKMIGVTGTNGKTSVAYLVRDILRTAGLESGILSTVQYEIGTRTIPASRTTPEAPLLHELLAEMVAVDCQCAVMEVSSHGIVQKRTAGIEYDVTAFTNLSRDHLDYHETMDAYFEVKSRLFADLGKGEKQGTAVINADDEWGKKLLDRKIATTDVIRFGESTTADVCAESIRLTSSGSKFRVKTPWGEGDVDMQLLGRFSVSNALAAIAVCGACGVDLDTMTAAIQTVTCVPGRLEEVPVDDDYQVFVDYAHTDAALEKVLMTVREYVDGRVILVFGCGGNRDHSKRAAMGLVASRLADISFVTSDNPRSEDPDTILAAIVEGFKSPRDYRVIADRGEAIAEALAFASKADAVVIAGKGHETFQEFEHRTAPFDDRQVVLDVLAGRCAGSLEGSANTG